MYLHVVARHKLREHAAGLLEQSAAHRALLEPEALRHFRQVPRGLDGGLGDREVVVV